MLGTTPHYLSYAITQNSKITIEITMDSSAICRIHANRRLRNFRLLKGGIQKFKCTVLKYFTNKWGSNEERIAFLTLLGQTFI